MTENLTAEGALREWPFWVTYAQFEALYELRPPRDMQRVAWLEHLCATRCVSTAHDHYMYTEARTRARTDAGT